MTRIALTWDRTGDTAESGTVTFAPTRRWWRDDSRTTTEPVTVKVPAGGAVLDVDPTGDTWAYQVTWTPDGPLALEWTEYVTVPPPPAEGVHTPVPYWKLQHLTRDAVELLTGEQALTAAAALDRITATAGDVAAAAGGAVQRVDAAAVEARAVVDAAVVEARAAATEAGDAVTRAEASAAASSGSATTAGAAATRADGAAEQADAAATLSQRSALSVMPMLSGSVTITPTDGTLAVDLGQAVNVANGLAGTSGAVDVIFPTVTTPDGRVNPDGLGTLLRVDGGAERLTWPGGTVVHGTPPEGQAALASLVRVGGAVTVVWPPDVVTSVGEGVTAQIAEIEQIIGGEVEVQPGGTVMQDAQPGIGRIPAVFVNPYSRPTSSELVLTVGKVEQTLFSGDNISAYNYHRPGGFTDQSLNATVDLGTSGEPVKNWDGWLIAVAPGPAYVDPKMTNTLYGIVRRVATSTLEVFTDGTWGVVVQYNPDNPHWSMYAEDGQAWLFYDEKGQTTKWEHGLVKTSGLDLPLRADESAYASLGITLPGTFHRAAELGDMGVYIGE